MLPILIHLCSIFKTMTSTLCGPRHPCKVCKKKVLHCYGYWEFNSSKEKCMPRGNTRSGDGHWEQHGLKQTLSVWRNRTKGKPNGRRTLHKRDGNQKQYWVRASTSVKDPRLARRRPQVFHHVSPFPASVKHFEGFDSCKRHPNQLLTKCC